MDFKKNIKRLKSFWIYLCKNFPQKEELGFCGNNAALEYPLFIQTPKGVILEDNTRIRNYAKFINSPSEKIIIKKYSVISSGCTIVPNSHRSTATIPQILLGGCHINDKTGDVVIGEDCWLGINVTVLSGVHIGRGSVIAAGAVVSKDIPPYSLAVGIPAKVIKSVFTIDQILKHEKAIYPEEERLSREYLEDLFDKYFKGMDSFGTDEGITEEVLEKISIEKLRTNFVEC